MLRLSSHPEGHRGEDVTGKQAGILKVTSALTAGVSAGSLINMCATITHTYVSLFYFHLFWDVQ